MVEREHFPKTQDFTEAQKKYKHLREYVQQVSKTEGVPEWHVTLDRSMRSIENPNIIYPVGDPIFVHISRGEDLNEGIKYKVIEPVLTDDERKLYEDIFDRMISIAHTAIIPTKLAELREQLYKLFDKVCEVGGTEKTGGLSFLNKLGKKISLSKLQYDKFKYFLGKERVGSGIMEPLFRDIYIEDISCVGVGSIWMIHKIFEMTETNLVFKDDLELNKYVVESSERVERPVSEANPVVDAIMPDGSRVNYIYSRKVSLEGSSYTIRKFNESPISFPMLVNWGTWSADMAAYLWLCCESGISIFVCGETASGKTTTLNAMCGFIPMDNKVYTVENTPEITIPHPVWQHLVTRESGEKTDVTMFDLLLAALRSRPDYIIVGEIRGIEANVTFQAMQTGHPAISTFHAGSVHAMIQRLTGDPINIPLAFIDCLNVVLIQSAVFVKGRMERRVLSITEIIRYNDEVGKVLTKEVFHWDSTKDVHQFRGLYNSFIMEQKIAHQLGLHDPRDIYNMMKRRTKIVDKLIETKTFDYMTIVDILRKFRQKGESSLPFKID